jgi:hypothetical protein
MTKEEVLQRANEYCNERSYDESTLTPDFKEKFADFFAKKNPDGDINDEAILADLKFNLDTAKSASAKGRTSLQQGFTTKETEYKNQIAELNKKLGGQQQQQQQQQVVLPKEVQDQLDELKRFRNEESKKIKFRTIVDLAKKNIREDLHNSFEKYAKTYNVSLDKDDNEQAKDIANSFQEIFKDSIGDIRPRTPKQIQQQDDEIIKGVKKFEL